MPSQYGEDQFILQHFAGRIGRFLDIGAFDGVTFSNTWPLAQLGWSGVCVEPSPPAFCWLMKAYAGNPKVELVCAAVVGENLISGGLRLRKIHCNTADALAADMLSTLDAGLLRKWPGHPFREIRTCVIDWADLIFDMSGDPNDETIEIPDQYDFVNIDVEGLNGEVLDAMPIRPEMVCVEWDKDKDGDQPLVTLERFGYQNRQVIGGNILAW